MLRIHRYVKADGDMDLDEWMEKEANEEFDTDEFYLDAIVAERGSGANKKYIIKWKACRQLSHICLCQVSTGS